VIPKLANLGAQAKAGAQKMIVLFMPRKYIASRLIIYGLV
jgi:hypothetical protein